MTALSSNIDLSYNISYNMRRLFAMHEVNASELSRIVKIQRTRLQRLLDGELKYPKDKVLVPIAEYFSITLDQLKGLQPIYWENIKSVLSFEMGTRLPVYSMPLINEHFKQEQVENKPLTVLTGCDVSKKAFSFIIRDNSLGLLFNNGTTVICDPDKKPVNDRFSLIKFKDQDELILRKVYIDANEIYVKSPNPLIKEDPVKLGKDDEIFATVVEIKMEF